MPDTWTEQEVLERIDKIRHRKPTRVRDDFINMAHGAGGKATHTLIEALFEPILHNPLLAQLGDQAIFSVDGVTLALTTDSYVVSPIIFPGGDIGELAVNGTVNDLAVGGATPLYLSAAVILEEGLDIPTLTRIVESMRRAADRAGVAIVTGDTKVVPKGKGDRIFINTTGVGVVRQPGRLGMDKVRPGDAVLVNGTVGDHGTAIMIARGDLDLEVELESDTAPLHTLIDAMLEAGDVHFMRDATRGGVATVLNEIARQQDVGIAVEESAIPVRNEVRGVAEILGIDPLYMASEGRLIAVVAASDRQRILEAMRQHPLGEQAVQIGEVRVEPPGMVFLRTAFGGTRVIDMMIGDPLPRIC